MKAPAYYVEVEPYETVGQRFASGCTSILVVWSSILMMALCLYRGAALPGRGRHPRAKGAQVD